MITTSLEEGLLEIPGVEGADVERSAGAPSGLRIRIAEGADQLEVGGAIRRVLSSHGLGTDTQLPGEVPTIEDEDSEIIDLTDPKDGVFQDVAPDVEESMPSEPEEAKPMAGWGEAKSEELPSFIAPRVSTSSPKPEVAIEPVVQPDGDKVARLERVNVSEGRSGVEVTVTASDGNQGHKVASSSEGGVEAAIVMATAHLANPLAPEPGIVDIEDRRVDGVDIVMVVLDQDGQLVSGASIVKAGRPFALARATWAALAL